MAQDNDAERTEPASLRRLEQAREEGDVPRSRDLTTVAMLLAAGLGLWAGGGILARELKFVLASALSFDLAALADFPAVLQKLAIGLTTVFLYFLPLGAVVMLATILAPLAIGGWVFSTKAFLPNFMRMNPLRGLGNMVSSNSLMELIKAVAKSLVVGFVVFKVFSHQFEPMLSLVNEQVSPAIAHMLHMMIRCYLAITCALLAIAVIDVPYQLWHYADKLKMSRQEIQQEMKESEGNPQMKARIRSMQRERARRRMMSQVPTADVVVTNPTHYAVALKYSDKSMRAPIVVAKGANAVAAKIRELANEHHVPILEAPPLARALFRHTELEDEIPATLYAAVAEVLAYVFQLRLYRNEGGLKPAMPSDILVPQGMDSQESEP